LPRSREVVLHEIELPLKQLPMEISLMKVMTTWEMMRIQIIDYK
jgi:hypothetical protein